MQLKPGLGTSYNIRPRNGVGPIRGDISSNRQQSRHLKLHKIKNPPNRAQILVGDVPFV